MKITWASFGLLAIRLFQKDHPKLTSVTSREKRREFLPPSENLSSRKTSAATAPIKAINNVKAFIYDKWSEEDRKITKTSLHGWPGRTSDGNCTKLKAQNSLPCLRLYPASRFVEAGYWTGGERIAPIASCQQKLGNLAIFRSNSNSPPKHPEYFLETMYIFLVHFFKCIMSFI